jgi:hypothetical protein
LKKIFSINLPSLGWIVILLALAGFAPITAQVIDVRGIGDSKTVTEDGKPLAKGEAAKTAARRAAVNAIDRALKNQSDNIRQQFAERVVGDAEREGQVQKIINDIKLEIIPIPEQKTVRATIAGKFDLNEFNDLLNSLTVQQSTVKRSALELAVFFTVRSSIEVARGGGVRETQENRAENSETAAEEVTEDGLNVDESSTQRQNVENLTETVEQADKVRYKSDSQLKEPFGTGLIGQFLDKGFEGVVDGSFFEGSDLLDLDITARGNPSPTTLRKVVKEITEDGELELLVIGSLDFAIPTKDPVSGMWSVETTMSGKVMRASAGKIPRTVAALEPRNFKGVGQTQEIAKKRALEAMSPLAADEIISKLKNNGVIK